MIWLYATFRPGIITFIFDSFGIHYGRTTFFDPKKEQSCNSLLIQMQLHFDVHKFNTLLLILGNEIRAYQFLFLLHLIYFFSLVSLHFSSWLNLNFILGEKYQSIKFTYNP